MKNKDTLPNATYIQDDKLVPIDWEKLNDTTILSLMASINLTDIKPATPGAWPNG
ncbi:hypothetical protein LCGC14_2110810 [marine sediment metagenome]|uniref:Uncharacterized protein n=1 Tax=marine sediment metagenome TaxID=412755 RepID=A0A0F9E7A4_9ZZZZ